MKLLSLLSLFSLASAAFTAEPPPPDRLAPLRSAAATFYTELRTETISGLPSEAALKRLQPHLTPELHSLIVKARVEQQYQIQKYPDEKPNWIEGDLFSSLFEGVTRWELGSAFSAPGVDATVKVKLTHTEGTQTPVQWTDTLVFKQRRENWLLDDIRMGGEWAFKSGSSLRSSLPGGWKALEDHDSPDERWHVSFEREGDAVNKITIQAVDKSSPPQALFGQGGDASCPFPTWALWSPDNDLLALRLGDSPRFTHTRLFRLVKGEWLEVKLPELYPEEKKIMAANGFRERDSLMDAHHWQDAKTLVVEYFTNWTKGDEGDGYAKLVSLRLDAQGRVAVVEAVDTPGDP